MLKGKTLLIALCFLTCSACAPFSNNGPTLEQRVDEQDAQLRQMQPQQADAWNQIQAMRQEIAELKGQLDDLNNAGGAKAIADRVRQHDAALRQVDSNMALNLELGDPMTAKSPAANLMAPTPAAAQTGIALGGNAPESSAYAAGSVAAAGTVAAAATAAQTTTTAPQSQPMGSYGLPPDDVAPAPTVQNVQAPSDSTWGQADPKPETVVQVPTKDLSLALFDAGVNSFNARDYSAAEKSFKDLLKNYPNHSQAAEAQFYLAECQFQRNRFPEAALAYDTVIKKYPKSSSAPGAYLKQGISFGKMNQPAAAKARMQELISKFPKSPEAARAKSYLKTNK